MIELRTEREKMDLSQTKLAHLCGISRTMIVRIEHGKNYPSVYLAQRIGKLLDFDWWELYPDFTKGSTNDG